MRGDSLFFNGKQIKLPKQTHDINALLGSNFIYTRIHTIDHQCLLLSEIIEICEWSYRAMYGSIFGLDAALIRTEVQTLLIDNNYPMGSAVIMLYLLPNITDTDSLKPIDRSYILSCREQLLYTGYTNWHSGAIADILPYDIPFALHQTAASLTSHKYAEEYVKRIGAHIVLRENRDNIITSASEYPLFGVVGREVRIAPLSCGTPDSIERIITINAAESLGLDIAEYPHTKSDITQYDEIFYVTPQGVRSIIECEGAVYPNIIGRKIGDELHRISLDKRRHLNNNLFH